MPIELKDLLMYLGVPLVSGIFAWLIAKINRDSSLFQSYIDRLTSLEKEVDRIKEENIDMKELFNLSTSLIDNLVLWISDGSKGKKPRLHSRLKEFVDPSFWDN